MAPYIKKSIPLLSMFAVMALSFSWVPWSLAQTYTQQEPLTTLANTTFNAGYNSGSTQLLTAYVGTIIQYIIATLGIIIFILIIYAGFRWMTAQGNSEQVDEAKAWLRNGVIGLVLVMMAYGIALFIVNRLGGAAGIVTPGQ